ncbi:multicopper oxidase family protein [Paenibacillus sp. 1001270B_150601_E10]|uniref:multicopper oxidase family protein n=1 Tax=Paenibacillus sp. 1001270B_150601_E10 TaxID=2787079 RepID=UPI00189DF6C7|nr:multicopper oxidase domain-containing protein [Paenibacillus sp. 1001270B_150601_E10]
MKGKYSITKLWLLLGALTIVLAGCTDDQESKNASTVSSSNVTKIETVKATPVVDGKTYTIIAKPSLLPVNDKVTLPVWTFNQSVPGPEIRVKVGDTVRIKLQNELEEPVSIHWHGYPVPNEMDGIPGVTQDAVVAGKEFVYEFKATIPGTYWYHSHQDSVNQLDKGLYGSFIVEDPNEDYDRDYTLMLDEWMSAAAESEASKDGADTNKDDHDMPNMEGMDHGSMGQNESDHSGMDHGNMSMNASDSSKDEEQNAQEHGAMEQGQADNGDGSMQHEGMAGHDMSMYDLYTINGKTGDAIDKLVVKEGDKVRLRLINAGYITHRMHLHGHEFKIVALDGQPVNSPALISDQALSIAPGERYDIEFIANNPGSWLLEEHGTDERVNGMRALIQYEVATTAKDQSNAAEELPEFDPVLYGKQADTKFTLNQNFDQKVHMNLNTEMRDGEMVYTINGRVFPDTEKISVKKGEKVLVTFVNQSMTEDHPMHLHGHFFQVLSKNGKPLQGSPVIKDTLNVRPGETYEVAFEADNPGDWMFHCHDLHHASAGMVTDVMYKDYKSDYVPDPSVGNKPE